MSATVRYLVGDVLDVLATLPDQSVNSVITSPPYLAKRAYLPADHPDKALELGQEATPADFLAHLLAVTDELWRVVRDDGTIWFNLGDTASGSGGAGGDYNADGLREGQPRFAGSGLIAACGRTHRAADEANGLIPHRKRPGPKDRDALGGPWPRAKSVCWLPELFGASLAYGRNLLSGEPCRQWITRPPVTWCKPNPPVGEIIDKFREATELIVWASKQPRYYFDLDSVRTITDRTDENPGGHHHRGQDSPNGRGGGDFANPAKTSPQNPLGAPPLNWWKVASDPYRGAHFACFPPGLIRLPVIVSCPPGGVILDPFGGSGTTGMVAHGHGRSCILIDLDERNADLARERIGMWLDVEDTAPTVDVAVGEAL